MTPSPTPLDLLARSVSDLLGPGELGVVAARAGTGKTACLVQLALTDLLAERPVLHVALDAPVREVQAWYDRLLEEACRRGYFPKHTTLGDLRLSIERHRHIHSYLQQGFTASRLEEAVALMAEVMDFRPHTVVVDGFPFEVARQEAVADLRSLAQGRGFRLWLSALTHRHEQPDETTGLPQSVAPFANAMDLIVRLAPEQRQMCLGVLLDHGRPSDVVPPLVLDPASLLVAPRAVP